MEIDRSLPGTLELLNAALEAERIKNECKAQRENKKRSRKNDIRNKREAKRWAMSQWEV